MIEKKVSREDIEDMMNLTTLQKAMIYHYINNDRNNKYRIQICIEFNEALDYSKVKESWDKVACDNEMLRTVFRWKNISQPVQIVLKKQPISVCYYDVTYSNNIEEAFNKIKNYQREEAMNLEWETFRVSICKVSDKKSMMLIQYHHIILDGWSFGIILEEFIRAYQGEKVFPKTKMKYSDYINYIQNRNNSKGISFWKEYLLGVKNACELYSDIVRQTEGRERIVEVPLYIPDAFIQRSTDISKLYGLTFASILYFVWSYILSRYTKSSDILFGTSVSGREHYLEGIQNSVGEYANAVPFRYYFDDMEKSCLDVIKKICNATIKRNQYSDMPLDQIKEYCGLINLNTLYNTIVVVDNYPIDNLQCYNGEYIKIKEIYELNDYDMTLQVFLYHGVEFKLVYNENKFSSDWVSSFASCFTQSFCWIITHLNEPIHSIQMLSAAEKERLIYTYGQCKEKYLCNETIMDIFERKVNAHPNDIALVYQKKVMTYQALNEAATKLASYLMNIMHTNTSDIIGIMIDRSFEMVIGIFGILKLGAAYLPIGIDYPKSRIEYILQNSNTELVLTVGRHKELEHLVKCIDIRNTMSVSCIPDVRLPGSKSTNPAYVLYTSGTTGKPKGVIISNESVVNMLHILNQYYPIHPQEAILLKTVYTFDISVTELFGWILGDGKLVIPENNVEKNVDELVQYIKEYHILGMNFVPSAFLGLLNVISMQQCQIINQMKYIFLCGETVQPELINLFVKKIHGPKLVNLYGPTETTIYATASTIELRHYSAYETISIGKPLPNYGALILDFDNEIVPENMDGELCLYGKGVSLGYLNNQEMTKEKFIELDWLGEKIYKTGDLARWDSSGNLYFRGRMDSQVKLRGYRIELGEIENTLLEHENIEKAAVLLTGDKLDILSAFIVCKVKMDEQSVKNLCRKWLPEYMVPAEYIFCDNLLYTDNGKIDKNALYMKSMERKAIDKNGQIWNSMRNKKSFLDVKQEIVDLWTSVLNKSISQDKTFFENGGNSLTILKVYQVLKERYELKVTDLFQYMTIDALASYLSHETEHSYRAKQLQASANIDDIAVIGMGGKYPLANDLNEFWENLCNGVEASRELTEEEFNKIEDKDKNNTNYVRYTVSLEDYDCFDSEFFGYSARESEMTDPQQRVFLECAYHALEDAGIATQFYSGRIGVMAGTSMSSYLLEQGNIEQKDKFNWMIANDKDFLNTKISYKLNLTGPSVNVQTACSSSLVAVHLACNMLKNLDADVMVVGGVSIRIPHNTGYLYQEGGILAKDGHCRAFDINATGTISGNGCGVIILTRLQRAISERAHIYAIIKGSAINNDGNHKISFSAPSIQGQVEVIANSLRNANLMPSQIGYIETHGTGTKLGDPIEFAALREIYTNSRGDVQPCAIGSIKSNIGHLDAAAGITGLVKAIMCLEKKKLVPSINYHQPNPELNLHGSGLYVNTEYKDWECTDDIRRAAVSSFGIGGTNASVIVEEYVKQHENVTEEMNGYYVLLLSAKRESAIAQMSDEIEQFADANPNEILNIQYTLAAGRNHYNYRTAILTSRTSNK